MSKHKPMPGVCACVPSHAWHGFNKHRQWQIPAYTVSNEEHTTNQLLSRVAAVVTVPEVWFALLNLAFQGLPVC